MSTEKDSAKVKMSKLVLLFYIFAALMGVMFIYMFIAGVSYINNYTASYGMSFSDMWADAIQYILSSSVNYLVFAMILLGIGKVLDTVQRGPRAKADEKNINLKEELVIEDNGSERLRQELEEAEKLAEEAMASERVNGDKEADSFGEDGDKDKEKAEAADNEESDKKETK